MRKGLHARERVENGTKYMALDLEMLKKHPYAVGGVVIVGGLVVFYLLSSSGSSGSGSSSGGSSDYQAALGADAQISQTNAAAQVSEQQTNAQLQAAQLSANVADYQTSASLQAQDINTAAALAGTLGEVSAEVNENASNNYTAVTEQANNDVSNENIYGMQESVLADQINSGVEENANNNAAAIAADQIVTSANTTLGLASLNDATGLAQQQQTDFEANVNNIIPLAGQQKNSALDATDQTSLFQTILSGGNAGVASAGTAASASATASGNAASVAKTGGVITGLTSLLNGLLG
jgi:hypothetical protein